MVLTSQTGAASLASGLEPQALIDAHELNLGDYLNRPLHNIFDRLGQPRMPPAAPPGSPDAAPPADPANPNPNAGASNAALSSLAGLPAMLIQPLAEALGTLGSGQFGDLDPTQLLGGVTQVLQSAGQSVQQAMTGLGGVWQGAAATSAAAKTSTALTNGAQVASQAMNLSTSLSVATASVAQAEAQLIAIANQFLATLAAIGPNIIFPWGIAEAIAAANLAITQATDVMSQLVSSLGAEAGHVTAVGAPVAVTSASQAGANAAGAPATSLGGPTASLAGPLSTLGAPGGAVGAPVGATSGLGSSFAPMTGLVSSLASPAMEGVSAATGAIGSGAGQGGGQAAAQLAGSNNQQGQADDSNRDPSHHKGGPGGAGGGGKGPAGGMPVISTQARLAAPAGVPEAHLTSAAVDGSVMAAGTGAAPMMGGAPMGLGAKAGLGKTHNAAAFLHTNDQGDGIIGDLGGAAPPVLGIKEASTGSNIDLRI